MGRYYSGDINGKFWFALQSSTAANRFGGYEYEPSYIEYQFEEEHLPEVIAEIKRIEDNLGPLLKVIDDFFVANTSYNDEMLENHTTPISKHDLNEYADLQLGIKIRNCLQENGECNFTAEL